LAARGRHDKEKSQMLLRNVYFLIENLLRKANIDSEKRIKHNSILSNWSRTLHLSQNVPKPLYDIVTQYSAKCMLFFLANMKQYFFGMTCFVDILVKVTGNLMFICRISVKYLAMGKNFGVLRPVWLVQAMLCARVQVYT